MKTLISRILYLVGTTVCWLGWLDASQPMAGWTQSQPVIVPENRVGIWSTPKAVIPENLVGVWATADSLVPNGRLSQGVAFYLFANGNGAVVVGPPPTGLRVRATYTEADKTLEVVVLTGDERFSISGQMRYNAEAETITLFKVVSHVEDQRIAEYPHVVLHRLYTRAPNPVPNG
ncbi:MAG: hypothetical protein AAGG51_06935 [Cyanobacteria bacterium P01_G01_bin.54]